MATANQWWICVTTSGSDGVIVATTKGSAESKAFAAKQSSGQYIPVGGPYTTLAAANKALPTVVKYEQSGGNLGALSEAEAIGAGIIGAATMGVHSGTENPSGQNVNSTTGLAAFLGDITSANLWIRVAKIGIGGTILIVGLAKLTGADQKIGGVVSKATEIAPLL